MFWRIFVRGGGKIPLRNRKTQDIKGIAALLAANISHILAHCGIVRGVRALYIQANENAYPAYNQTINMNIIF